MPHRVQVILDTVKGKYARIHYLQFEPRQGDLIWIHELGRDYVIKDRVFTASGLAVVIYVPDTDDLSTLTVSNNWHLEKKD